MTKHRETYVAFFVATALGRATRNMETFTKGTPPKGGARMFPLGRKAVFDVSGMFRNVSMFRGSFPEAWIAQPPQPETSPTFKIANGVPLP